MKSPIPGRPPLNVKVFKEVYNALKNRSKSWNYIYGDMNEPIYCRVEGLKKSKDLKDFAEGLDYFRTEEALLQCIHDAFKKNGHDIDIQAELCTEVDQSDSQSSSSILSQAKDKIREISDETITVVEAPVSPMVKLTGEEAIKHLFQEEKSGSNANYYLFPKIYPHLQEIGWKRVEDLSHGSFHLAPWAAKSVGEGGIILANGRCDVSLRDTDQEITRMLLNRDYFVDNKKIVSYIRKHGLGRIAGLPSPATGDKKRVRVPTNYFRDTSRQQKVTEETTSSSRKTPQTLSRHTEEVDEDDDNDDDDDDSESVPSVTPPLELSGEEIVISTIKNYNTAISNGVNVSYNLLSKLLPLLEDIGWKKAKDTKDNSAFYIAQWASSFCEEGGVMLANGKCDVTNKLGGRSEDAGAIILNRDYFSDFKVMIEYLTTHGCRRVEEALIANGKEEPRRRGAVVSQISASSNSLTNAAAKVVVAENKGKKHPVAVTANTKVPSGSSSSSSSTSSNLDNQKPEKSVKNIEVDNKLSAVSFEPLQLPVQSTGDPGKIDDEFRTDQLALLHMILYPTANKPHLNLNNHDDVKNALRAAEGKWHWLYSELGTVVSRSLEMIGVKPKGTAAFSL
jgi:hypothetical protein